MDNMENYENCDLMSSEFFDTIRDVEECYYTDSVMDCKNLLMNGEFFEDNATSINDSPTTTSSSRCSSSTLSINDVSMDDIMPNSTSDNEFNVNETIWEQNDKHIKTSEVDNVPNPNSDNNTFVTIMNQNTILKQKQSPIVQQHSMKSTKMLMINNGTKILRKSNCLTTQLKTIGKKHTIVKAQPITSIRGSNTSSTKFNNSNNAIILPSNFNQVRILNVRGLNTKAINTNRSSNNFNGILHCASTSLKTEDPPKVLFGNDSSSSSLMDTTMIDTDQIISGGNIQLTIEEKRLLAKEGISLPEDSPLTKVEERELKRIRRKIRNKISAQDSRRRKKEYVDGLEDNVRRGSEENELLMRRIKELQKKNRSLVTHINRLQSVLLNSSTPGATSVCLMAVMLAILLVTVPNNHIMGNKNNVDFDANTATHSDGDVQEAKTPTTDTNDNGKFPISRTLLSTNLITEDDTVLLDEYLQYVSGSTDSTEESSTIFNDNNETDGTMDGILLGNNNQQLTDRNTEQYVKQFHQFLGMDGTVASSHPEVNGYIIQNGGFIDENALNNDLDNSPATNSLPNTNHDIIMDNNTIEKSINAKNSPVLDEHNILITANLTTGNQQPLIKHMNTTA